MKKLASYGLVALISLMTLALPARADSAARFTLTVDRKVLFSGERFTATATSRVDCDWILEWNGERKHQSARRVVAAFTAPAVTRITRIPLKGRCFYAAAGSTRREPVGRGATSQRIQVRVPPSWTGTVVVTVLPAGGAVNPPGTGNGELPSTGGPDRWLLLLGLGAVLAGSVITRSTGSARPARSR